jgi:predicted dehydrogenase
MDAARKKLRIGVIGCGRISQAHVDALAAIDNVVVAGVLDTRKDAAKALAEVAGCDAYTDFQALIRDSNMDGAIVCAPPAFHRDITIELLKNGVGVLCEKPLATRPIDALAMAAMAEETERTLMMASKFRYVPDVARAKALIASGQLGEIKYYENCFCAHVNMEDRWNIDPAIAGGGVIMDNGTHSVDIARYLLGTIDRVNVSAPATDAAVEDTATLQFSAEHAELGAIHLSWSFDLGRSTYVEIHGTEGALRLGWQGSHHRRSGHGEWESLGKGYDKHEAFLRQTTNFLGVLRGTETPFITHKDMLASVHVIEAAYRSLDTLSWEIVEDGSWKDKHQLLK